MIQNKVKDCLLLVNMNGLLKIVAFVFCVLFSVSCVEETVSKPKNLINQEKMILVLTDVCKTEARFQRRLSAHGKSHNEIVFENYKLVFDEYDLTIGEFKDSYTYYEKDPELMQQLYDSVIVILTKEQSELEKKNPSKETDKK